MNKKLLILFTLILFLISCSNEEDESKPKSKSYNQFGSGDVVLRVVSGSENRELEPIILL